MKAGIPNLADPQLGRQRLDRLNRLMEAVNLRPIPDDCVLAEWIQSVALSLERDGSGLRTWGSFYGEARKVLAPANRLRQLAGKTVLKTRDGSVQVAAATGGAPVFVRESGPRDRDRAPLPTSAVASKFAILDDGIPTASEVVADLIKTGLLRRYDALQVLQSVQSLFGEKPAPKRREATLKWAFEVWRAERSRAEKILREIDLRVETRSGWRPASTARFSEGWTVKLDDRVVQEMQLHDSLGFVLELAAVERGRRNAPPNALNDAVSAIMSARHGQPWAHPRQIEDEVDTLRHHIRALRTRIAALDPEAASIAREHARGVRRPHWHAGMTESGREATSERATEYSRWVVEEGPEP